MNRKCGTCGKRHAEDGGLRYHNICMCCEHGNEIHNLYDGCRLCDCKSSGGDGPKLPVLFELNYTPWGEGDDDDD